MPSLRLQIHQRYIYLSLPDPSIQVRTLIFVIAVMYACLLRYRFFTISDALINLFYALMSRLLSPHCNSRP